MQVNLKLLRERLGQFGLNPLDWCVEIRAKRGNVMMMEVSAINGDLRIEGWAEDGNWLSLAMCDF